MAVGLTGLPPLHPVQGVSLGIAAAGIKKPGRRDLVVMWLDPGATCATVFTRNAFCAAPVLVAKRHLAETSPRCFVINTGNANAGTGEAGIADAEACCRALAELTGCMPEEVLPFSTGVIGEPLPVDKIISGLPLAVAGLSPLGWAEAAQGIMTTDTAPKGASRQFAVGSHLVTVTGIAKGAGMIRPDMATMLAFVATNVAVPRELLQQCLQYAVDRSFNRITVDGDTSTNDACSLIATGRQPLLIASADAEDYAALRDAVTDVCIELAQAIVRDAEGATKFITLEISQGRTEQECAQVAYTIAHSPLVKTALFASDPNWGRILAAVGRAGLHDLDVSRVNIYLDEVCVVHGGARASEYREEQGQAVMNRAEIMVRIELGRGEVGAKVWTCDLSHEYVHINAEYRT